MSHTPPLTDWQRQMAAGIAQAHTLASNPVFQLVDRMVSSAEARMPKPANPLDIRHAVRAGNLKPAQIDDPDTLLDMLDEYCTGVQRNDEDGGLWVRILATVERMRTDRDLMVEALEIVALTPKTRGVYVLDEQDMQSVRMAVAKAVKS